MTILFVSDQTKSKQFYQTILALDTTINVPGMTEFTISKDYSLGLMPGESILKILENTIPDPHNATGIPRCELYLFVDNPTKRLQLVEKNGGKIVSEVALRPWGDEVGYGLDPDGHLIALAKSISDIK
jgi:predicted enzyme related to lactoylglutathione lyase